MAVSEGFLAYVLEQLESAGHVTSKKFFGGAGLYAGGPIFGLIDGEDRFYLKVDDSTRPDYEGRGMARFAPVAAKPELKSASYMTVPEDVLEDPDELKVWATKAMAVAAGSKT